MRKVYTSSIMNFTFFSYSNLFISILKTILRTLTSTIMRRAVLRMQVDTNSPKYSVLIKIETIGNAIT